MGTNVIKDTENFVALHKASIFWQYFTEKNMGTEKSAQMGLHFVEKQYKKGTDYRALNIHYTRRNCFNWQKMKYITTSRVVSEIQENLQGYAIPSKLSFEENSLTKYSLTFVDHFSA